ncbi:hypothetical protein A9Q99_17375 [Gammaproteobacteria bacterium 45_16_T64]|nr:hypothetical protein A9Q99_17375 [Gammaproteobacteria bacterium 45_16_T64]
MNKTYAPFLLGVLANCAISNQAISQEDIHTFSFKGGISVSLSEIQYSQSDIAACINDKTVCRTNGDIVFGSDNENPTSYLNAMSISVDGKTYNLDTSNMYNAWQGKPKEIDGVIKYLHASCFNSNNCTVRGLFSDAAGSYIAEWKVINSLPYRTVLTSSGDLVRTFIKNIHPPIYE